MPVSSSVLHFAVRRLAAGHSVSFAVQAMLVQSSARSLCRPLGPAGHSVRLRYRQCLFNRQPVHSAVRHLAVGHSELLRYKQRLFHRQSVHSAVRQDRRGIVSFCGTSNACFIVSPSFRRPPGPVGHSELLRYKQRLFPSLFRHPAVRQDSQGYYITKTARQSSAGENVRKIFAKNRPRSCRLRKIVV